MGRRKRINKRGKGGKRRTFMHIPTLTAYTCMCGSPNRPQTPLQHCNRKGGVW